MVDLLAVDKSLPLKGADTRQKNIDSETRLTTSASFELITI